MRTKISASKETISESSGSSFLNKSGIYDITIDFASVAVTKNGAEQVNFNIDYNGNKQTLWGPIVTTVDGKDVDIGNNLISKLGIVAGLDDSDELAIEAETHTVAAKGGKTQELEFDVITTFSDLPCKIHVQTEVSRYNGAISDRLVVKAFFREDGASAEEIVNDTEIGKRLTLVEEKYANNITFRDGVTPEEYEQFLADRKANASGSATSGKVAPTAAKATRFSRK